MANKTDKDDSKSKTYAEQAKERAKLLRRAKYLKAKEQKKNDPKEIARKAKMKESRRAAYQKLKAERKQRTQNESTKIRLDLLVKPAIELDSDPRPLAQVIPLRRAPRRR